MPLFARWRAERELQRKAAAYVTTLFREPEPADVDWLNQTATRGDVDHARWELRYARRALGLIAAQRDALDRYGAAIGEAFQIADDLLDVEGDTALVGKQTGKDAGAGKATMVDILGIDGAKARLRELVGEAEQALAPFGQSAAVLIEGAHFVADRRM